MAVSGSYGILGEVALLVRPYASRSIGASNGDGLSDKRRDRHIRRLVCILQKLAESKSPNDMRTRAFGDMDYHILELQQSNEGHPKTTPRSKYTDLRPMPFQYPSFALGSLMAMRNWTHLTLNEGSFLKAYGTYEYFERGPPSLVYSIKHCLAPTQSHRMADVRHAYIPRSIRSFTYIAIFPFANHADFVLMLPFLEEVDLQFAPEPSSSILDDKSRIGKAELSDCWQEMFSSYNDVATALSTFRMTAKKFPRLKKLTCRDYQIPALDAELDEVFTPLCMPVWVERERGVFTREAMDYRIPGVDMG